MSNFSSTTANLSTTATPRASSTTLLLTSSTTSTGITGVMRQTAAPVRAKGPPYPPDTAQLGGTPTVSLDVPICAAFLLLFIIGAVTHMAIFQTNRKRGHKFVFSALLFVFCMARIVALCVRIVWAGYPTDGNVAIAANVFTAAGVLLLFVINLLFAQRIVRACHPTFGWRPAVNIAFHLLFASIVVVLATVITVTIQSFFTLDATTRRIDHNVQLFCAIYLATAAFLPVPIVAAATVLRSRHKGRLEKFGTGRFRTKVALLVCAATLLALGASFRTAVAFLARPPNDPAWYDGRAAFYVFNYTIELTVVFAYAAARFDRRFHVPDGSSGPGDYIRQTTPTTTPTDGSSTPDGRASRSSSDSSLKKKKKDSKDRSEKELGGDRYYSNGEKMRKLRKGRGEPMASQGAPPGYGYGGYGYGYEHTPARQLEHDRTAEVDRLHLLRTHDPYSPSEYPDTPWSDSTGTLAGYGFGYGYGHGADDNHSVASRYSAAATLVPGSSGGRARSIRSWVSGGTELDLDRGGSDGGLHQRYWGEERERSGEAGGTGETTNAAVDEVPGATIEYPVVDEQDRQWMERAVRELYNV